MLSVKEEVEDNRENRVTRFYRAKKTSEQYIYSYKASVPASFLSKFKKNFSPNDIVQSVISKSQKRYSSNNTIDSIYYYYIRWICSTLRLKIKGLDYKELIRRLEVYHFAIISSSVGSLKKDDDIYWWFRKTSRPVRETDTLGLYKWFPEEAAEFDMSLKS